MSVDFAATLTRGAQALGVELPPAAVERLGGYFAELLQWSKKTNLVSTEAGEEEILDKHFLDSLALLPHLGEGPAHLLDIGSGAGFPGLACAAARPELSVTLVEPRLKRTVFLGHVARKVGLTQVRVLCCRAEDRDRLPDTWPCTHITCRALTELGPFLHMVERFAPSAPTVICMKGPKWREEMRAAAPLLAASPYRLSAERPYRLPLSGAARMLLFFTVHR